MQQMNANRQQMEATDTAITLMARQDPSLVDPELLDKFSKGSLSQRHALLGQMTAQMADRYRQQQLGIEQQRVNIAQQGADLDREQLTQRKKEFAARKEWHPTTIPGIGTVLTNEATGQGIQLKEKEPELPVEETPLTNVPGASVVRLPDGKYQIVKPNAPNPLDALLNTPGFNVNTPPPKSQTPKVTTKADFDKLPSGTVYQSTDGRMYRKP